MTDVPELKTRKPTGKPPWPIVLLAGGEKTGKSWAAAAFSASDLVGRTFFVEIGESYADEYGAIPGARYEICEHDGSYRGIGGQIYAATQAPRVDGKPNCIIVDSMTLLWDLLSDQAQRTAYARWRKKNPNKPEPDGEVQITMDLWNIAKKRWNDILDLLRRHDGPVLLTARLEQVAVMAPNGQPTTDKTLKVKAEKNLPYEVDVIVQMPSPRKYQITGLRSVKFQIEPDGAWPFPDFTVDALLRRLGLDAADATAPRVVTQTRPAAEPPQQPEASERGFDRSRPTQPPAPEADPWMDAPPADKPGDPKPSTKWQRTRVVLLCERRIGSDSRDKRLALLTELTGRPIRSTTDLSFTEAKRVMDQLEHEDGPFSQPNPRNGGGPVDPGVEAALSLPSLSQLLEYATAGEGVFEQLKRLIREADTDAKLERLILTALDAAKDGHITHGQYDALCEIGRQRSEAMHADPGWSHRGTAAMAGAQ